MSNAIHAVLFDLDGTLCDTAHDLRTALNQVLLARGEPILSLAEVRPVAATGARGLIERAFGTDLPEPEYKALRQELLAAYLALQRIESVLYPGMDKVLDHLDAKGMPWGIVTNKITSLTWPTLDTLGLSKRAACVVCGDTLSVCKPDPQPILHACALLKVDPKQACYVGDHARDIQAGNAAGAHTITALYGDIMDLDAAKAWPSAAQIGHPEALLSWLNAQ